MSSEYSNSSFKSWCYETGNLALLSEWDKESNSKMKITPNMIHFQFKKEVSWICSNGHKYKEILERRTKNPDKLYCPKCKVSLRGSILTPDKSRSGSVYKVEHNLKHRRPDIARFFNTEKNGIDPEFVSAIDKRRRYWWKCENGHEWQGLVYSEIGKKEPHCIFCKRGGGMGQWLISTLRYLRLAI